MFSTSGTDNLPKRTEWYVVSFNDLWRCRCLSDSVCRTGEPQARRHLHDHQDGVPVHVRHPLWEDPLPRQDQRADHLRDRRSGACLFSHEVLFLSYTPTSKYEMKWHDAYSGVCVFNYIWVYTFLARQKHKLSWLSTHTQVAV